MTRTRNMADLLDSSGDIKSSALDNVPPSNDASALTTGTLPAARLPATIDGRDVSVDGAKLDGIEASATADQTDAEIKTAYENNSDTNAFTDALQTKLNAIEANATADQSDAEIKTAYENNSDTNAFTDALQTKLNGIEASADVTDTANVTSAGALMTTGGTMTGNLTLGDGNYAAFGTGLDLQILHNGSNSFITDAGTGDMYIRGNNSLFIQNQDGSENKAQFITDGAVNLMHNGATKFQTTSTGVTVTGTVAATAFTGDGSALTGITDTNTTYSAGNGLSLNGTQFNLGGNAVKQHIMSQPNVGILSKSGGWQEVHSSMRVSIACTSANSRILVRYTFTFGGNNSGQIAAFKIRDITGGFDVNMSSWQNRSASHGTTRHVDTDVNDVEQLVVAAVVEAGQTSTSARTYSLYFKNESNGGTTKYFNGWAQNLSQGFYNKPICEIMEL